MRPFEERYLGLVLVSRRTVFKTACRLCVRIKMTGRDLTVPQCFRRQVTTSPFRLVNESRF